MRYEIFVKKIKELGLFKKSGYGLSWMGKQKYTGVKRTSVYINETQFPETQLFLFNVPFLKICGYRTSVYERFPSAPVKGIININNVKDVKKEENGIRLIL
jgi:hypothetical protein